MNLEFLVAELRSAERIYLDNQDQVLVVLMPDAFNHLDEDFFFTGISLPQHSYDSLQIMLDKNRLQYISVPPFYPYEAKSPDGRLLASWDGIFLVETGEKIAESPPYGVVRGWLYDGSGVIYSSRIDPCLLNPYFPPVSDAPGCMIPVPQPVVKLRIPERYYSSSESY